MSGFEAPIPSEQGATCSQADFILALQLLENGTFRSEKELPLPEQCEFMTPEGKCGITVSLDETDDPLSISGWEVNMVAPDGAPVEECAAIAYEAPSEEEPESGEEPSHPSLYCLQFLTSDQLKIIVGGGQTALCTNAEEIKAVIKTDAGKVRRSAAVRCGFTVNEDNNGALQPQGKCVYQKNVCILPARFSEQQ